MADSPRPRLRLPADRLDRLARDLAAHPEERRRFLADPGAWLRSRGVPAGSPRLLDHGPAAATSEVCTVNTACNVNATINVNAATKVNAVSAVNAALTANAAAFVNFIAAHRTLVFNQTRFWGGPKTVEVKLVVDLSPGRFDGLV
jgi:hypothetical protein